MAAYHLYALSRPYQSNVPLKEAKIISLTLTLDDLWNTYRSNSSSRVPRQHTVAHANTASSPAKPPSSPASTVPSPANKLPGAPADGMSSGSLVRLTRKPARTSAAWA